MRQRLMLAFAGWSLLACGGPDSGRAGDVTVSRETAGDTNVVTISGDVPDSAVRQLVAEMRIAPGADDVSLFTTVYEFDVDAAGQSWVFDQDAKTILRFDSTGALIQRIGREGAGPGEFRSNNGMVTLPGGGLALWDGGNSRITFFDSRSLPGSRPMTASPPTGAARSICGNRSPTRPTAIFSDGWVWCGCVRVVPSVIRWCHPISAYRWCRMWRKQREVGPPDPRSMAPGCSGLGIPTAVSWRPTAAITISR
jgi:hypothetical protein